LGGINEEEKIMFNNNRIRWAMAALAVCFSLTRASSAPVSGLYQIVSGTYDACCGIGGDFGSDLPSDEQSFVRLTIDKQSNLATMTFLGKDMETIFSIEPCPAGNPVPFSFDFGFILSNSIVFHVDPGPPPLGVVWNYAVSNEPAAIRINGTLGFALRGCLDVPDRFSHSNVVAVLLPEASIRVSEVEVCWSSVSNLDYQVQYRSTLTTNVWTNLGSPVAATNASTCVTDKVARGEPQRFYRVLLLPTATPIRLLEKRK
jgi:hypothetical protein